MTDSIEFDFLGIPSKQPYVASEAPPVEDVDPDAPITVSLSQLLTWDRCRYLWKLQYVDKWAPVGRQYKMELGTMGHAMLFDYYKTGLDNSAYFANKWIEDWSDDLTGDTLQNIATATSMFKLYIHEFSPTADRGLRTDSLEEHFQVTLKTPRGREYVLEGYIDRTSFDERGYCWVEDYKWTGRFWTPNQLLMDPQLSYYAGALLTLGRPVHGLMITQINTYPYKDRTKKKPEDLFKRDRIYRSPEELRAVMSEIGLAVDEMIDERDKIRRSLRRDCDMCRFIEPCMYGLKGIDPDEFLKSSGAFQRKQPRPKQGEYRAENRNRIV